MNANFKLVAGCSTKTPRQLIAKHITLPCHTGRMHACRCCCRWSAHPFYPAEFI